MSKRVRTTRRLEVWLKDTSVALFVLNSQRRLVFFNTGCEQLTGWTPSDVLGQICDYVTEADTQTPAALLASLAPPANVWHGHTIAVSTLLTRREQGPWEAVLHFFPLTDVAHKVQAALGIIQPAAIAPQVNETSISQRLHTRLAALRYALRSQIGAGSLLGQSTAMRRVFDQLRLPFRFFLSVNREPAASISPEPCIKRAVTIYPPLFLWIVATFPQTIWKTS